MRRPAAGRGVSSYASELLDSAAVGRAEVIGAGDEMARGVADAAHAALGAVGIGRTDGTGVGSTRIGADGREGGGDGGQGQYQEHHLLAHAWSPWSVVEH